MAANSHHLQRSPEDLQQLRAWYKIRDTLLGHNQEKQDIKKAFELAALCKHPDAVWLTKLFAGSHATTKEDARPVFLAATDLRARSFAAVLEDSDVESNHAASLGDAFAQSWMARKTSGEDRFRWAERSAGVGERDAFYWLGYCYRYGHGCEKNLERAKENFLIAADLGVVAGMLRFAELLEKTDPQRFVWFGNAAANGSYLSFLDELEEQMRNFNFGNGNVVVVFAIGRALKGQIDRAETTIFGKNFDFENFVIPANQALSFYEFELRSYRRAVDAWTVVGLRFRVVKDIRKMIAMMIWDAREEAAYPV
jgi:hypothetical protein